MNILKFFKVFKKKDYNPDYNPDYDYAFAFDYGDESSYESIYKNNKDIAAFTVESNAYKPIKAYLNDAGWDLCSRQNIILTPHDIFTIDTGVHVDIPNGYFGLVLPRSSISNRGILVFTGVIDSGYKGSVKINIMNLKNEPQVSIKKGDRVAQLILMPYYYDTIINGIHQYKRYKRGYNGFGSSGKA